MRRGFALTLSMIMLIFFLTLILSVESQRIMIEEQTRANHAQMRAVTSLLADMESPALSYSVEKLAKRSLYDVDMKVIESPTREFVKDANKEICDSFVEKYKGYLNSLATRANDSGLTLTYEDPICDLQQHDAFNLTMETGTLITISGRDILLTKSLHHSFNFSIQGIYDPYIAVKSYDPALDLPPYNMVLIPIIKSSIKTDDLDSLSEYGSGSSSYGKGWVYGEVVTAETAAGLSKSEWGNRIIVLEGKDLAVWGKGCEPGSKVPCNLTFFRGVILLSDNMASSPTIKTDTIDGTAGGNACKVNVTTTAWDENTAPCIECGTYTKGVITSRSSPDCEPTLAASNYIDGNNYYVYVATTVVSDPNNLQGKKTINIGVPFIVMPPSSFSDNARVLLSSEIENELLKTVNQEYPPIHGGMHVYDIEKQRAATLCANYFYWNDGWGMNIFQKLEGDSQHKDKYGIESFVLGPVWANADHSKIDHQYFSGISGHLVKGMPGCITPQMCNVGPSDLALTVGQIKINGERDDDYGMSGELEVYK